VFDRRSTAEHAPGEVLGQPVHVQLPRDVEQQVNARRRRAPYHPFQVTEKARIQPGSGGALRGAQPGDCSKAEVIYLEGRISPGP
jgi:hypothetical protein